ncbi:MAG: carbohydrate ABC transporter permease [Armatimonadetes bacterium]|nr:carbohydrate ABC transporter permease [Armatimonadota bacterium]
MIETPLPFRLSKLKKLAVYLALVALCLPALMPLLWMVSTSFKTDAQVFATGGQGAPPVTLGSFIPHPFDFTNYPKALAAVPFQLYLRNTVFLVVVTVLGAVFSSAVVAHGFAKCHISGKGLLFGLMLATMALPGQVTMVPYFVLFRTLGWYGTYLPLVVPVCFGVPFYIFLMTQFMRSLPVDLYEAGRIDGVNEWRLFTKVTLPLSRPALATCALFQFVNTWNDFLGPLLYLNNPARYTVAYGLQQFLSRNGGQWTMLMAASTIFVVPVFLVFLMAQKTFVEGIATTGGKN